MKKKAMRKLLESHAVSYKFNFNEGVYLVVRNEFDAWQIWVGNLTLVAELNTSAGPFGSPEQAVDFIFKRMG